MTPVTDIMMVDVAAVRRFNRFYTKQIGLIEPKHLRTEVSLPEARILYELSQRVTMSPGELTQELHIDPGQLSRTIQGLVRRQLISRTLSTADRRQADITLTKKGRELFSRLDLLSQQSVMDFLALLSAERRADVVASMKRIESALSPKQPGPMPVVLRPHQAGDIGWIASRHGALYARDYGWTIDFEAIVADIGANFTRNFDPAREACWIAEVDGERAGSVMIVKGADRIAKLRLLLVEPNARGLGVGKALVDTCLRFAREKQYDSITLWTQSILLAARDIYQRAGFRLIAEEPHRSFGHDLIGETWELAF